MQAKLREIREPYNPLDKQNLGLSVAEAVLSKPLIPLPPAKFIGAGIYAIYYGGDYGRYNAIKTSPGNEASACPIYVGKAVPEGSRKGGLGLDAPHGYDLHKRLVEHAKAIDQVQDLRRSDFFCRHLVVDDIWIPLGESLLIECFHPLWNITIDGFGNHDPGKGRYQQQMSAWDVLHPGRSWALKCREGKPRSAVLAAVGYHFQKYNRR